MSMATEQEEYPRWLVVLSGILMLSFLIWGSITYYKKT